MSENDDIERFRQQLQDEIMEKIRKDYSSTVIDHWEHPRNFRRIEKPDGYAKVKGSCGDSMEMYIKMRDDVIVECAFFTDGCATTIASGSIATEIAINKSFTEALAKVSAGEILKHLGGLPEADEHCAQLASEALRRAMADALHQKKSPWKKAYRKIE